jgi:hypothetical protein
VIPPLSRRTALASGLGAAGLTAVGAAGCSADLPGNGSATPTPTPGTGGLEPDVQIVVDLVDTLRRSTALLTETVRQHPELDARLTPLLRLERRHLAVLQRAAPDGSLPSTQPSAAVVPGGPATAQASAVRSAEAVRAACRTSAGSAESGAFARLLASMGAAVSQRLVVVAQAPPAKAA